MKIGKSFKAQLLVYGGGLVLFVAVFLLLLFSLRMNNLLREDLIFSGKYLVPDFSRASELSVSAEDPVLVEPFMDAIFSREEVTAVSLYNYRGLLLFHREEPNIHTEESISPQIRKWLEEKREALKIDAETKEGAPVYDFYAPVIRAFPYFSPGAGEEIIGFAKITLSLEKTEAQIISMMIYGFLITALVLLIGVFLLFLLARSLTNPLLVLKRSVDKIKTGNLNQKINIKTENEIGELAQSFNQMVENLQRSQAALKESKKILEIKVEARTKELRELTEKQEEIIEKRTQEIKKRVEELEKFHKLSVDRELKMVELKEEIRRLKKNGENNKRGN